jgi:MFS family permease
VHDDGLVRTGLLLAAYGGGGIVALPYGGRLTDRFGGGVVATGGNLAGAVLLAPFIALGAGANTALIEVLLFGFGVATALSGMPLVSTAYAAVRPEQMPDAATLINIGQRIGGAIGVAGLAVVLARASTGGWPSASGFRSAFGVLTGTSLLSAVAAAVVWRHQNSRASTEL